MDIQEEKLDIIQWVTKVNDSRVIGQLMLIKKSNEEGGAINLTSDQKDALDNGIRSIKEGRFKSHQEVMEATRKKYPDLYK